MLEKVVEHDAIWIGPRDMDVIPRAVANEHATGNIAFMPAKSEQFDDRARRLTPRHSLIIVLPDNHVVSPASLADQLRSTPSNGVDVIVACAGQPTYLQTLQRTVHGAQFLLAPEGTTMEALRELAIKRAPGDVVTLLDGGPLQIVSSADDEILKTS